jgi:hypothetical protein
MAWPSRIVFARLLLGWIVLICAEVFSGASLQIGLWHPFVLLLTYWLYFAHFFFFTTLAIRTGRTSWSALYLWGVLFGLYESWITKVIWSGYHADGKFVLGHIGPYGTSEISMVFFFHPVMSFLLPLAVACLLCPELRRWFPELAWFSGKTKWARATQFYLLVSFAPVMAMNSGGPVNLAANLVTALLVLWSLKRLAGPALAAPDAQNLVAFGRSGFAGLCSYLALLYGLTYFYSNPQGRPSIGVQLFTFVFYALAAGGLRLHRRREASTVGTPMESSAPELRRFRGLFLTLLILGLALSFLGNLPAIAWLVIPNFFAWTIAGFLLTGIALSQGIREFIRRA